MCTITHSTNNYGCMYLSQHGGGQDMVAVLCTDQVSHTEEHSCPTIAGTGSNLCHTLVIRVSSQTICEAEHAYLCSYGVSSHCFFASSAQPIASLIKSLQIWKTIWNSWKNAFLLYLVGIVIVSYNSLVVIRLKRNIKHKRLIFCNPWFKIKRKKKQFRTNSQILCTEWTHWDLFLDVASKDLSASYHTWNLLHMTMELPQCLQNNVCVCLNKDGTSSCNNCKDTRSVQQPQSHSHCLGD